MTELTFGEGEFLFNSSDPSKSKTLSQEQVVFWNKNGYISPIRIGDEKEADIRCKYVEHLFNLMEAEDDGRTSYDIVGYQTRCGGIWDLVIDPRILDIVEDLIGENIICWSTHYFNKLPKDPKAVPPHQDASYWHLSPQSTITCWLAIDPSTVENGCVHLVPGSHTLGHLDWEDAKVPHALEKTNNALSQSIVDPTQYGEFVPLELQAGEMSIHTDKTVHGSVANQSSKRRCGIAIRYCTPDVKPIHPDWGHNAILCRGEDTHGNFDLISDRPEGDDMASWHEFLMKQFMENRRSEANAD